MGTKIVVGTNSYVTLDEADSYISDTYMSFTQEYKRWFNSEITDSDKETALISSALALNTLKYQGSKQVYAKQALAFPRRYLVGPGVYYTPFVVQCADTSLNTGCAGGSNGIELAKRAQIENAVAYIVYGCTFTNTKQRSLSGLKSKAVADVRETYDNSGYLMTEAEKGIYAPEKVRHILAPWLSESIFTV